MTHMTMKIKSKVFQRKTGKSKGKWVLRIEYYDDVAGRDRIIERHAEKRADAKDERDRLVDEVKKSHGQMQTGERMTYNQLADICEKLFYGPAVIHQGRKVSGVRSVKPVKSQIKHLRKFFGKRLIKEITTESLTDYKLSRLKSKKEDEKTLSIATVNRELSVMRKMMRHAYGKGWIFRDIFFNAKVIDMSAELERKRIVTRNEEARLLASCHGEREITYKRKLRGIEKEVTAILKIDFPQLRDMIILALDSGMRRGEIFKLEWADIDFDNKVIEIWATNTKTERDRLAPLSQRAKEMLEEIKKSSSGKYPFPYFDIKKSFNRIKDIAKVDDLEFKDFRRTAISRWLIQGTPSAFAGKLAGHTQLKTTFTHYTAAEIATVNEVTERMDNFNNQKSGSTK